MRLEVRDLKCGYDPRHPVQDYLTFSVEQGEVCCILGPNGCGKSTLFKTLLGLVEPLGGTILLDGASIASWSARQISNVMSCVQQQSPSTFPYQVHDVVLLGRVGRTARRSKPSPGDYLLVEQALRQVGIYDLRDKMVGEISGGEYQMVKIAKLLAQQTKVVLLDEPTSALDYGNALRVISSIRSLAAQGFTIVMTTHSPNHAFMCQSNVLLLRKDAPMKFGRAVDVITEKNIRDAYGVSVKVVEFVNANNEVMRMCAPEFGRGAR